MTLSTGLAVPAVLAVSVVTATPLKSVKSKGDGGGREKKRHDNLRQTSQQFTTFYDIL